jgi:hypothetical protein
MGSTLTFQDGLIELQVAAKLPLIGGPLLDAELPLLRSSGALCRQVELHLAKIAAVINAARWAKAKGNANTHQGRPTGKPAPVPLISQAEAP